MITSVNFPEARPRKSLVVAEGFFDAAAIDVVAPGDALGVDAEEDLDAVAGPFGDLGRFDAAVEPGGQAGVAQVVRPPGERRVGDDRGERKEAGTLPGASVDALGQVTAAFPSEESAVRCGAELGDVPVQVSGQCRVAWDGPDFFFRAVLELPWIAAPAGF